MGMEAARPDRASSKLLTGITSKGYTDTSGRTDKGVYMKRMWAVSAALIGIVSLSGCVIVQAPVMGVLGSKVKWGEYAQGDDKPGQKEGRACMDTLFGLLARGDASVRAAKANGGITEVSVVDHSARNFLNIVGEYCTIVRGT